jgi:putative transposase
MTALSFHPGNVVTHQSTEAVIVSVEDPETVLIQISRTGELALVPAHEVCRATDGVSERTQRLSAEAINLIKDRRWTKAKKRIDVLRPLLRLPRYSRRTAQVAEAAEKLELSLSRTYALMQLYDESRCLRDFLRVPRSDRGVSQLLPKVERTIRSVIKCVYLTLERPHKTGCANLVRERCRRKGWPEPSVTAVVNRINALAPVDVAAGREGRHGGAPGRYQQRRGRHPGSPYLLYEAQLDHTPSDYCIVSEEGRLPIEGAQTLSVALDLHSRCVLGFTLFIEAPSIRIAGTVMSFAILPKERYMKEMGIDASWPCYGKPTYLYMDNGPDLCATDFEKALDLHGIEIRRRKKKSPNYAAHIETAFKTFLRCIHQIEGTRFSNIKDRLNYDPQGRAIMTLDDFRKWFTIFVTMVYHNTPHTGLDELPPIIAWRRGVIGFGDQPGIGLPDREVDELRLRLDFLPTTTRTIQVNGVAIGRSTFQDTARFARYVGATNAEEPDGKFVFKYDPFNFAHVFFYDPADAQYYPIARDGDAEHVTLWDYKLVKKQIRKANSALTNQAEIDRGMEHMREVRREAAKATHKARRDRERERDAAKHAVFKKPTVHEEGIKFSDSVPSAPDLDDDFVFAPLPGGEAAKVRS